MIAPLQSTAGFATFDEHALVLTLAAVGLVIVVASLLSGVVERLPVSQVLVFIALGVLVGPWGLDVFAAGIESPAIGTLATLSLVLVLFTDAIGINLGQLRSNWVLPALALGPGTVLTILLTAGAARALFGLSPVMALLLGTILASTDAVLLRDITRDQRVPLAVRHALSVEAGTNDVVVLPLTLVLALVAAGSGRGPAQWAEFGVELLVLGPLVGAVVALIAVRAAAWLRARRLIRHEYESIYSLGVAFLAYAAAQLIGGSGFVAAFAAGLTISLLDVELCDCFLEYGETTAEVAMLLTFVGLGAPLAAAAVGAFGWTTALFALFVLVVARPVAMLASLARADASAGARLLIAWFGPRGLNSLLLLILALEAGIPASDRVFGIVSVVVLASILLHGVTATPLATWYGRQARAHDLPEETMAHAGALLNAGAGDPASVPRIGVEELAAMLRRGDPATVVDVRRRQPFEASGLQIPGAKRIPIDELARRTDEIPRGGPVVPYCT